MSVDIDNTSITSDSSTSIFNSNLSQSSTDVCENVLWSHLGDFFELDTHDKKNGKLSFLCLLCKPKKKYISASISSNSNLRTHIKHIHHSKLADFNKASKTGSRTVKRKSENGNFDELQLESKLKQKKLDSFKKNGKYKFLTKRQFDQVTVELVINTASAFSFVEHEAFIKFCETTIQQTPMTRKTLMTHIDKMFVKMKMELVEELNKVEWVCLTADCWTAFKRAYLGMTIHWLDTLGRKSKGIACRRLQGRHTYDVLAKTIESILIEFNVQDKTTCIVTDNARNFEKAFRVYSENEEGNRSENESGEGIESVEITEILTNSEESYRLPPQQKCASHTLNLVSTVDMISAEKDTNYKGMSRRAFAKCQAIFNKQNQSSVVADMIKASLGKYLKVPNATRWNSFYDAIVEVTDNIEQVNALASSLKIPILTPTEIDFLKEYCMVMGPIAKGLDILQRDKHIFMGYLLPTLVSIEEHLNEKLTEVLYVKPLLNALLKGIRKRFHHLYKCNELRIATCLIPNFKLRWIQNENEKTELTDLLKSIVQEFNHENYVVYSSTSKKQVLNKTDKTDEFFKFNKTLDQNQNDKSTIEYIIQTYLSTDTFSTEKDFPKALKCAFIKYNTSIPSSAHVERLFSAGGLIFDNLRGKMSDKNFEMALLLKFNNYIKY